LKRTGVISGGGGGRSVREGRFGLGLKRVNLLEVGVESILVGKIGHARSQHPEELKKKRWNCGPNVKEDEDLSFK